MGGWGAPLNGPSRGTLVARALKGHCGAPCLQTRAARSSTPASPSPPSPASRYTACVSLWHRGWGGACRPHRQPKTVQEMACTERSPWVLCSLLLSSTFWMGPTAPTPVAQRAGQPIVPSFVPCTALPRCRRCRSSPPHGPSQEAHSFNPGFS